MPLPLLRCTSLIAFFLFSTCVAIAQDDDAEEPAQASAKPAIDDETLKRANDPLANVKAFNIQDYYASRLYGRPDAQMNQLLPRYAQPFGNFLFRATMPIITSSVADQEPVTGFGDLNLFAIYCLPARNGNKFGIGPNLTIPTGTNNLGQGKWQTGISALAFFARSRIIQIGSLLQWQTSFAGDEDRPDVSLLIPQLFCFWQIGGGTYLRSTGILSFDLTNGHYNIPVGLGIGKVIPAGKVVFNIFAEPQLSVAAEGAGQPAFQTFFGFNTQF